MAQKKAQRKPAPRFLRRWRWGYALGMIGLLLLGGLAWWIYQQGQAYAAFQEAIRRGQPALNRVETFPEEGRAHLLPGERANYRTDPPHRARTVRNRSPPAFTQRSNPLSAWSTPWSTAWW